MENLISLFNIINTKLGVAVITFALTNLGNFAFNKWKVRKDQKARFENVIGDKIAVALEKIRDIELSANIIESYNTDGLDGKGDSVEVFDKEACYPAIMEDKDTFKEFADKINDARVKYDRYLDYQVGALLYYMERYCMQVMIFLRDMDDSEMPMIGAMLFGDIQKWQKECEKVIIHRINYPKYKYYKRDGMWWERAKRKVDEEFWQKSVLYGLVNGSNQPVIQAVKALLEGNIEEVERIMVNKDQ